MGIEYVKPPCLRSLAIVISNVYFIIFILKLWVHNSGEEAIHYHNYYYFFLWMVQFIILCRFVILLICIQQINLIIHVLNILLFQCVWVTIDFPMIWEMFLKQRPQISTRDSKNWHHFQSYFLPVCNSNWGWYSGFSCEQN